MVPANNAAAGGGGANARTATADPARAGRTAVRLMTAWISASYHMLSTPAAPAPAAMARTAAKVVTGSSRPGAQLIPTSAVKTASIITRGFVRVTKSDSPRWPASGPAEWDDKDDKAVRTRLSPSWPAMVLTFIPLLQIPSKDRPSSSVRMACMEYASPPSPAIERGCSIGANHALNRRLTSSVPATRSRSHDLG